LRALRYALESVGKGADDDVEVFVDAEGCWSGPVNVEEVVVD